MKKHRTLRLLVVQTRSMLGPMRCLFSETFEEWKFRKCREVLYRWEKSTSAVTGRHMFVSMLVSLSSDLDSGAVGGGECSVARLVVTRHGARCRVLSRTHDDIAPLETTLCSLNSARISGEKQEEHPAKLLSIEFLK